MKYATKKSVFFSVVAAAILVAAAVQTTLLVLKGYQAIYWFTPLLYYISLFILIAIVIVMLTRNKQERSQKLILIAGSIVFTCIAIEYVFRITHLFTSYSERRVGFYQSIYDASNSDFWLTGHTGKYTLSTPEYTYSRVANSMGYGDNEWPLPGNDSCFRIMALGDSFTEGDGTHADSTWLKFLERKCNNQNTLFMNAGLCGSDPVYAYKTLTDKLIDYRPHMLILCVNNSDIFDAIVRGGFERFENDGVKWKSPPRWEPLYAVFHLMRPIINVFYSKGMVPRHRKAEIEKQAVGVLIEAISKFQSFCSSHNTLFVCVVHPMREELWAKNYMHETIVNYCSSHQIVCIDLFQWFEQNLSEEEFLRCFWIYDGHHNAFGYSNMANGIWQQLYDKQLIDSNCNYPIAAIEYAE